MFIFRLSYTLIPVWLVLVGMAIYIGMINETTNETKDNTGDLMLLGMIEDDSRYSDSIRTTNALSKVYYENQNNDSLLRTDTCNIVVIGDSFSHGGGIGPQGDYVNYLAHISRQKVVVYAPDGMDNPIQIAYDVLNLGVLDSTNVKNLIVEEVERHLISRHHSFVKSHTSLPRPKKLKQSDPVATKEKNKKDFSPLLRIRDYVFYHVFNANPINTAQLSKHLFSSEQSDILYFYDEDLKSDHSFLIDIRQTVVDSYQQLIAKAREKGVNLIIIIACDKYDLYQDFIVNNRYPAKTLNEDIAQWMNADIDRFVLTKQVLYPYIKRGVKDIFLFNDTHWSPFTSQVVAEEVVKKLK